MLENSSSLLSIKADNCYDNSTHKCIKMNNSLLKILIVEDNLLNQKMLKIILEDQGCSVEIANNGEEAVNLFRNSLTTSESNQSESYFQLIFMDIEMPEKDGISATKEIFSLKKDITIIGISNASDSKKEEGIKAGMLACYNKPYRKEEILQILNQYLSPEQLLLKKKYHVYKTLSSTLYNPLLFQTKQINSSQQTPTNTIPHKTSLENSYLFEDIKNNQLLQRYSDYINCIAILPNGNVLIGSHNKLKVWDVKTGQYLHTLVEQESTVHCIAVLPNGNVISGSHNKLKMWDIKTGQCLHTLGGHSDTVFRVAVLPNGNVLSGALDGTLKVWDIHADQCMLTLQGHCKDGICVAVLPNGNVLSGALDGTLKVWDIHTGQCLNTLQGHSGSVYCVAVLPNGNIISGSQDQTLKVWDIHTGKCLNTLCGHSGTVYCVAVLPNGDVISGSSDATLKVWDINRGQCVSILQGHSGSVCCVTVLPNGNVLSGSHMLQVWIDEELQNEYQIRKAARILAQGYRDLNCPFALLSPEINYKIAGLTGNSDIHIEEQTIEIAKRYFRKP